MGILVSCLLSTAASIAVGECNEVLSGSCPDSTTLLQNRVLMTQELEEEQAASADVQVAVSTGQNPSPPHFLIMSSSSTGRVLWTMRQDMDSANASRVFTLIDQGLKQPRGLAFDQKRGFLYIADSGAQKIFRFMIIIDKSQGRPRLTSTHVRLVVVQNCGPVEWVTLDDAGNLFYSAPHTNNINKISAEVVSKLASGEIQASALTIMSEKMFEVQQIAANARKASPTNDTLPKDPPPVLPHIFSMYEAKLNPHVAHPAAICVDGPNLYWTNQGGGATAGTVVKGQVNPKTQATGAKTSPAPFPSEVLTKMGSGARGLAKTREVVFFTRSDTLLGTSVVSGLVLGTTIVLDFLKGLAGARSLVWDKERTMYVADEVNGEVFAFPTGRVMANAPRTLVASVKGAYGLAITSSADPWFNDNSVTSISELRPK